jgi:hypothetical protein
LQIPVEIRLNGIRVYSRSEVVGGVVRVWCVCRIEREEFF